MPEWYVLLRAAKFLGVAPWELAERPALWTALALAAESAEADAEAQRRKKRK